jgi:alpha-tubulin suppressor-like RCC1 family protein
MPILGTSSIFGSGKGPTGPSGAIGPVGATGNSGLTKGNTGSTAIHIERVVSDSFGNIKFYTTDDNFYELNGFYGPTGYVSDSSGVSSSIDLNYVSLFKDVNTGLTFEFYGLSAGTNVGIALSADREKIIVSLLSSAGGYNIEPVSDYLVYTNGKTLSATQIHDNDQVLEFGSNSSGFKTLYTTLNEEINFIDPVIPNPLGGITLDLTKNSNHWLTTPIGITAFISIPISGIRQEYTLFIEGPDVWNLPKNLYFQNTEEGIANNGFLSGLNIVHIWSENGGVTFNANIIERGIGSDEARSIFKGSCCYKKYGFRYCDDLVDSEYCKNIGGVFQAMTTCFDRLGIEDCGRVTDHNIRGETGACCCGITGCLDESNVDPLMVQITRDLCHNTIKGKFYPKQICKYKDKGNLYATRSFDGNTYNGEDGIICHKPCIAPVACCRIQNGVSICTQETRWYCENVLRGEAIINKTCEEVQNLGGCSELTRLGYCTKYGVCDSDNLVVKHKCLECGSWSPERCETDFVFPVSKVIITTQNPIIRIVHSVKDVADNVNVVTTYSEIDPTVNFLTFQVSEETAERHTLYGGINFLDVTNNTYGITTFDIWNLKPGMNNCFEVDIKDEDGITLDENTQIFRNTNYYLKITAKPTTCTDTDFKGQLFLGVNSCSRGYTLGSRSELVPLIYTRSPCTCIAVGKGFQQGDIINKAPIIIPFTAERYCYDCTKKYKGSADGYDLSYHIPYPLKRQSGFVTFCPPTETLQNNPLSLCTNIEAFCVSYGPVEELSGCTYSSLFDSNGDYLIQNETNILNNCFHAEYNEPGSGTTYFYTGLEDQYIRPCNEPCRRRLHYGSSITELRDYEDCTNKNCFPGDTSSCCKPTTSTKSTLDACRTCAGNPQVPSSTCSFSYYFPYFNKVNFDINVLYDLSQKYDLAKESLEEKLVQLVKNKGYLFDPKWAGTTADRNVGGATINRILSQILYDPDPDNRATEACESCVDEFDLTKKIEINSTASDTKYSIYGLHVVKENLCNSKDNNSAINYTETNFDNKYYIFVVGDNCYYIYDIGTQKIVKNGVLSRMPKTYDTVSSCSLLCDDYNTKAKEVKWFGDYTPTTTGCQLLPYNIKKILNETVQLNDNFKTYKLDDLIEMPSLTRDSTQQSDKLKLFAKLLVRITKNSIYTHYKSTCPACKTSNCFADLGSVFTEFIGRDCSDILGLSGTVNEAEFVFDTGITLLSAPFTVTEKTTPLALISAGYNNTVGIEFVQSGTKTELKGITGWGKFFDGELNAIIGALPSGTTYCQISSGPNCICALAGNTGTVSPSTHSQIDAGMAHVVVLRADNEIRAWGDNTYGQCDIPAGITATAIKCGDYHTCAFNSSNKKMYCWGRNHKGQCDIPDVLKNGDKTITQVAAGLGFTIVRTTSPNEVIIFGEIPSNTPWEWGDGFGYKKLTITTDTGTSTVSQSIAAGSNHILIARAAGGLTGWGDNSEGQLSFKIPFVSSGAGYIINSSGTPFTNGTITNLTAKGNLSAAAGRSPGLVQTSVAVWGKLDNYGNIKNSLTNWTSYSGSGAEIICGYTIFGIARSTASYNLYGLGTTTIPAGRNYGTRCVQLAYGNGFCIGFDTASTPNYYSGFGDNPSGVLNPPTNVLDGSLFFNTTLKCAGNPHVSGAFPTSIQNNVRQVAVGGLHTVWLDKDGIIKDSYKFTSPYNTTSRNIFFGGASTRGSFVSSGKYHSCAVLSSGSGVTCWGDDTFKQISIPTNLTGVKEIHCGGHHSVALKSDGSVVSWGITFAGINVPPSGVTFNNISAGYLHTCGVKQNGTAVCWGYTFDGQCDVPVLPTNQKYSNISCGRDHTVATIVDSTNKLIGITCWGIRGKGGCCTFNDVIGITFKGNPSSLLFREGYSKKAGLFFRDYISDVGYVYKDLIKLQNNTALANTLFYTFDTPDPSARPYDTWVEYFSEKELMKMFFYHVDNRIFSSFLNVAMYKNAYNQFIFNREEIDMPEKNISFYIEYKPYQKSCEEIGFLDGTPPLYDTFRNFKYAASSPNKEVIEIRKTIPKIDPKKYRSEIRLSGLRTYIKTTMSTYDEDISYTPIITFNLKKTNTTTSRFYCSIYHDDITTGGMTVINQSYSRSYPPDPKEYLDINDNTEIGDGNLYIIKGPSTKLNTDPILNFNNKYLAVFSATELDSSVFKQALTVYPSPALDNASIDRIADKFNNNTYLNSFVMKPLPLPENQQNKPTTKKLVNSELQICLEIDCSEIPEICSDYDDCS